MSRSANELEGLAAKAARGAGAHAAQAAHFGRAFVIHLARGRSGNDLAQALRALPGGVIQTLPLTCRDDTSDLGSSYREAMARADLRLPLPDRIDCPQALYDLSADLAHLVYVPNTDASRAGGAGAGLNDND